MNLSSNKFLFADSFKKIGDSLIQRYMSIFEKIKRNPYINYHDYYRFRYTLDGEIASSKLPREKYTLHIIKSSHELKELNQQSYDFCESPVIETSKKNVDGNQTLFLYFVDKKLAHANCIVGNDSIYEPTLKDFKACDAVFVGPAYTAEQYRGKGFHVYDLVEGCKYYQDKGYKYAYVATKTTNKVSIFGFMAAGFEMIDKVRSYKIIKFTVCKSSKCVRN